MLFADGNSLFRQLTTQKENGEQNASEETCFCVPRRVSRDIASGIELDLTAERRLNEPARRSPEWLVTGGGALCLRPLGPG